MIGWLKLWGWRGRYVVRAHPLGTFDFVLTHPFLPGLSVRFSDYPSSR